MANTLSASRATATKRESIGSYRLLREFGDGGGTVYSVEEAHSKRRLVLKLLRTQPTPLETRLLMQLQHEHIVPIIDLGEEDGQSYLVTEQLKGETLLARLKREHQLPLKESLRIAREMASGLTVAHAHGVIHKDICPANIWIEPSGRTRLLGFGSSQSSADGSLLNRLDGPGTPGYLSPEQAAGEPVTPAADLFGLGCVLYQMATGERPFRGDSAPALIRAVVFEHPQSAREINPDIPEAIEELLTRLLAKLPSERPASAQEVEHRLMEWLDPMAPKPAPQAPRLPEPMIFPASKRILETIATMKNAPFPPKSESVARLEIIAAPAPSPDKKRSWLPDLVAIVLLIVAAAGLYFWWQASNEPQGSGVRGQGSEVQKIERR